MLFDPKWMMPEAPTKPVEVWRDLLRQGADLIERYGHRKQDVGSPQEGFCVYGAMNFASTGDSTREDKGGQITEALRRMSARPEIKDYFHVIPWNNHPDTTPEQVISMMREVAING